MTSSSVDMVNDICFVMMDCVGIVMMFEQQSAGTIYSYVSMQAVLTHVMVGYNHLLFGCHINNNTIMVLLCHTTKNDSVDISWKICN